MAEGNQDIAEMGEDLGDGEVINNHEIVGVIPGLIVRDNAEMLYFLERIGETTDILRIPAEYSGLFFNRNQNEIKLIDHDNGNRLNCELYLSTNNEEDMYVGKGWKEYVISQNLKVGDLVWVVFMEDNPHNIHVAVNDRVEWGSIY